MPKMIFINLPVADLPASIAFYQAVGFVRNDHFADDTAQAMVLSETITVMLVTHPRWATFTTRQIPDAHVTAQMSLCVSEDNREAVDAIMDRAITAGSSEPNLPQDHGFMYSRSFEDPDGHIWEPMWMDVEAAMQAGTEA